MKDKRFISRLFILFCLIFISNSSSLFSQKQGQFRWAADAEGNAPYIFVDPRKPTGELIGFEVDMANAIAKELKLKPYFVQNQWDGLIPGLGRGDYDFAINGLEITEDRKKVVNFSIPYYVTYEQIVVMKGTNNINTLSDCVGRVVGALKNSLAERILIAKGGINVKSYEGEIIAFTDMKNGRLDAVLVDAPIAIYYAEPDPQLKLVGQPIGEVTYGVVMKKSDTLMLERINAAILSMRDSGELREIYERWNLWNYMMALYFDDKSNSNIEHDKYQDFIESMSGKHDFNYLLNLYLSFLPVLGKATVITLEISLLAMLLAIVFGLFIAIVRMYTPAPFALLATGFVEIIRGTPLLIQLLFIYYALPTTIGIKLNEFVAAIIGLGLNYAAYEAENYRAGLLAVPKGQMEAAISLGMTKAQALKNVILPQAIRIVIPPITNDFISLLKDSSLVSVIAMVELTKTYNQLASTYYDFFGTGILVAIIYLLIGLPFVKLAKWAERHFSTDARVKSKGKKAPSYLSTFIFIIGIFMLFAIMQNVSLFK